jgi:hypothetical protein
MGSESNKEIGIRVHDIETDTSKKQKKKQEIRSNTQA